MGDSFRRAIVWGYYIQLNIRGNSNETLYQIDRVFISLESKTGKMDKKYDNKEVMYDEINRRKIETTE